MWLIEHFNEYNGFHRLAESLKRQGIPHKFINMIEGQEYLGIKSNHVIFFGSHELSQTLIQEGKTGLFIGNDSFLMSSIQNCPYLLNNGEMKTLKEVLKEKYELFKSYPQGFFIRPDSYLKFFSGQVMTPETFDKQWKNIEVYNTNLELSVFVAPLKKIEKEVRLIYINNSLVTGSSYVVGQDNQKEIDPSVYQEFVDKIKKFIPDSHCTIDVAHTDEGIKLVEFNPLSTSAIYQSNPDKIIDALENI